MIMISLKHYDYKDDNVGVMRGGTGPFSVYLSPASQKGRVPVFASSTNAPDEQLDSSYPEQPLLLPRAPPAFPEGRRPALLQHRLRRFGGEMQW